MKEQIVDMKGFFKIMLRVILVFAILIVVIVSGKFLFEKYNRYQIRSAIKDGLIVIDGERHSYEKNGIDLRLYLRNTSKHEIQGTLVFAITLNTHGLEREYLNWIKDVYKDLTNEALIDAIENKLNKQEVHDPRLEAMMAYLERGSQLLNHMQYEPVDNQDLPDSYTIKFRSQVSMNPSEIAKINSFQEVAPDLRGYLVTVNIEDIEFD